MTTDTQSTSIAGTIASNLTVWACVIISFIIAAGTFVKGGLPLSHDVRNIVSFAIPFAMLIIVLTLIRRHVTYIVERRRNQWPYSILLMIVIAVLAIVGLVETTGGETYVTMYTMFSWPGSRAIMSLITTTIVINVARRMYGRSITLIWVVIAFFLSLWVETPLAGMYFPPLIDVASFVGSQIANPAPWWTVYYVGAAALVVRMILMREKLVP
jgi:hypothetical protein